MEAPYHQQKGGFLMALRNDINVNVFNGDPMPAHHVEVLVKLIEKAALRMLKRMHEEAIKKSIPG